MSSRTPPPSHKPPPTGVVAKPDPSFAEPCGLLPAHLKRLLEEWHEKHPGQIPPFATGKTYPKWKWKVFDREGRQLQLLRYTVYRPCVYAPLVLCCADGSQIFVASVGQRSKYGIFLVAWLGLAKGYETQCCAIRCFGPSSEEIVASPQAWNNPPTDLTPIRSRDSLLQAILHEEQSAMRQEPGAKLEEKGPQSHPVIRYEPSTVASKSESEYTDGSYETDSSEEESDGEDIPFAAGPAPKRRKVNLPTSIPSTINPPTPLLTDGGKVVFKMVSDDSKITRAVIVNGPDAGSALFTKARQFYQLLYPGSIVNVLSCKMPSSSEQRYLYEDDDEIAYLIREMKALPRAGSDYITVDVKRVRC